MKLGKIINLILAFLVTSALLYFLFSHVSLSSIFNTASSIPIWILVGGLFLYTISFLLRSIRFWILLDKKINIDDLFSITAFQNMMNNILPARTGELSYIYLLKKTRKASATQGIATLLIARLFDSIAVAFIFFISLICMRELPAFMDDAVSFVAGFFAFLILVLLTIIFYGPLAERIFHMIERHLSSKGSMRLSFLSKKMKEVMIDLRIARSRHVLVSTFLLSFLIWGINYFVFYMIVIGMGVKVGMWPVLLALSAMMVVNVIPLSIAGLGTTEIIWAGMMMYFGVSKESAISTGFGLHLVIISYFMLLGLYGFFRILQKKKAYHL